MLADINEVDATYVDTVLVAMGKWQKDITLAIADMHTDNLSCGTPSIRLLMRPHWSSGRHAKPVASSVPSIVKLAKGPWWKVTRRICDRVAGPGANKDEGGGK